MVDTRIASRRRSQLRVEELERRDLLAGIPFNFTVDDPGGLFAPYPLLMNNLQAAGQILSGFLGGRGSLEVVVRPNNSIPRAGGGTVGVSVVGSEGGFTIVENNTIREARTGIDPNGTTADIRVEFNTQSYMLNELWFDPSGVDRTGTVPSNRTDFISVALHEITHALGFQGYRNTSDGSMFFFNTKTTYDQQTAFGLGSDPNVLYFNGPHAVAIRGGPVPLTSVPPTHALVGQNWFHVGNPIGTDGSDLIPDMMNGIVFNRGTRYAPSLLDVAILADLSWTSPSQLQFSTAGFSVNENGGQATITVTRTDGGFGAVAVNYATVAGGSATAGADYTSVSGSLTWADGDTANKTFIIPIVDDALSESNETVQLQLSSPTGTAMLGTQSTALLTIVDNDQSTLHVTNFNVTSTGFSVLFNQAIDPSVLNLYDAQAGGLGPADIVLQNLTNGSISIGSVVLNATNTGFTFLQTTGILPPANWIARLRSGVNNIRTPGGALLDGNGDGTEGDDFVQGFNPFMQAVTVSIPNFMRGPGQPVDVPATGSGLRLQVSNGATVTSITLTLGYNPQLLTLSAAEPGPNVPTGSTATLDTSTPGQAVITFTSPTALSTGAVDFVTLTAQVPDGAGAFYTAKHLLDIINPRLNGTTNARDDDGLHVVGYLGDTTGNGRLTVADVNRAQRVAVGMDSGFLAYQLADPVIIADVNGNGLVNSTDAAWMLQEVIGIDRPEIPPLPASPPTLTVTGPDPLLRFPSRFQARPGEMLTVPLLLNPSEGLESADLAISYDTERLEILDVTDIQRGTLTKDFDLFGVNLDASAGTIRVALSRTAGPISGRRRGSILNITFRIKPNAPAGRAIVNLRQNLNATVTQLNEGGLDLVPDPSNRAGDVLDGRIQIGRSPALVDAVFAELARGRKKGARG